MAPATKAALQKVTGTVKNAAKAIANTAGEYVVEPVGKALGLVKTEQEPPSPARRKELKTAAKKSPPRKRLVCR